MHEKIFHLSESNLNGQTLHPRIPVNYLTKNGYEEGRTGRSSFAPTIDGCLVGMATNLSGKEFFVHEPENYDAIEIRKITNNEVPDASLTGEVWVTTPVKLKVVGKIKVGEAIDKPLQYKYGNHVAETYKWEWAHVPLTESSNHVEELYPVYVVLSHSGTVLSNAIKAVTKNPYSHSSISFDTGLENMYSFGRKYKNNPLIGVFVKESRNAGLYEDVADTATYSLYVTFVTKEEKELMEQKLQYFKDNKENFKYDFTGLFLHQFGKISERDDAYFCSGFVTTVLNSGREYFDRHYSLVKPYDFAKHKDFHLVTRGLLKNYDPKKVESLTHQIRYKLV